MVATNVFGAVTSAPAALIYFNLDRYDRGAEFTLAGPAGTTVGIESRNEISSDSGWLTLTNIALPSAAVVFQDATEHLQHFYRCAPSAESKELLRGR